MFFFVIYVIILFVECIGLDMIIDVKMEVVMKTKALYPVVLLFTLLLCTGKVFADEIDVKLDNVINNQSVTIDFDNLEPMKIADSTVVPLRRFCESAGLAVHWYDYEKKGANERWGRNTARRSVRLTTCS